MKKALILGTNAGQADIIDYLNETGWETHACGHQRVGPGCDRAGYFHLVDTTDVDAVKKLAAEIGADIVYSVSSDSAITSATKVSEALNLPCLLGSDMIELFNNKNAFREFLNRNGIGNTKYLALKDEEVNSVRWDVYPCVVKPSNSQGQRGVTLVNEPKSLDTAVQNAFKYTTNGEIIIQEYLDGYEFSTNVVVQNGEILLNQFSDRIVFSDEFFGLPKGHRIPVSYLSARQLQVADGYVKAIIKELDIKDAVLYIQMRLKDGEPRVIEIAPRLDGCHIWRLIKHVSGIDLREYAIKCLLHDPIDRIDGCASQVSETTHSVLEFYHLPSLDLFDTNKLELKPLAAHTEFRYIDGETILPINGKLEVVGYCIYDEIK